jgi:hypothetical protein
MKRSHAIFLGATGIIFAGAYAGQMGKQRIDDVPAAETPAEARIYTSLEECLAAHRPLVPNWQSPGGNPNALPPGQADCQRDFAAASATHVQAAPKFNTQSDCEAQYGAQACRPATFNGTSVFVPAMIGFMVANALSGNRTSQALLPPLRSGTPCPPGQTPETMPGCTAPRGPASSSSSSSSSGRSSSWSSFSTPSGHTVSRDTSKPAQQSVTVPSSAAAAPVARSSVGAVAPRSSSYSRSTTSSSSSSSTVSRSGFGSTGRSISSSSS